MRVGAGSPIAGATGVAYRAELEGAISREAWQMLSPVHKTMLDRLAAPPTDRGGIPPGEAADAGSPIGRPWICFAPGTADDLAAALGIFSRSGLEARARAAPSGSFGAQAFQFLSTPHWTTTALTPTNPSNRHGQGDPVILTWSIIPDGTDIPGGTSGAGEPASPSNLQSWLDGIYGNSATWLALFEQVFDRWEALTGVRYVYEPNDDGAPFPSGASSSRGEPGVRGDVRIGGHTIDGAFNTLAYNFGPNNGDMVIDTGDSFFGTTSLNSLRLRNVLAHEHGHGLGLAHVCPVNQTKLMEPFLTTNFDGPQHDDIFSANRQYGDRHEDADLDATSDDNDSPAAAADLGTLEPGTTVVANLSIDDGDDNDYYRISVPPTGQTLSVVLRPVGLGYLEGPQNSDNSCSAGTVFNSAIVHNLGFELRDADGSNVLATRNSAAAGEYESLDDFALPNGTGPYLIRVFGDNTNNAQLYELELTVVAPPVIPVIGIADLGVDENIGIAVAEVTLSEETSAVVSVQFQTVDGAASAPDDYGHVTGTLVFNPGVTSQPVEIPIVGDALDETDETFGVTLSSPFNGTLGDATAVVTIGDDDPTPELSITGSTVSETADSLEFTLVLSAASGLEVRVDFATVAGSADVDSDFVAAAGTLALPPGTTGDTISVAVIADADAEPDETFTLELSAPQNATLGTASATGTILDDDAPLLLAGTGSLDTATPGPGVTISWTAIPGRTYTVEYSDDLVLWNPLPGATQIEATMTDMTFEDPSPAAGRRFFRVVDDPKEG